jgi:hypothetical protein
MEEKGRARAERSTPPGDFTSAEFREQTARFLAELRHRAEKKRRELPKKPGPPPKSL